MYYKMFVPICFQVWPIFRLQIGIFAELLPILWFLTPPNGIFWLLCAIFVLYYRLNKNYLDIKECLKCIIKCLYQFVFMFDQFLDFKLAYFLNYCRFYDFWPLQMAFVGSCALFLLYIWLNKNYLDIKQCLKYIIKCLYQFVFMFDHF